MFISIYEIEKHFEWKNHDFNREAKFTIIDKIERESSDNITEFTGTREDKWIMTLLQTLFPTELNNKPFIVVHSLNTYIES